MIQLNAEYEIKGITTEGSQQIMELCFTAEEFEGIHTFSLSITDNEGNTDKIFMNLNLIVWLLVRLYLDIVASKH